MNAIEAFQKKRDDLRAAESWRALVGKRYSGGGGGTDPGPTLPSDGSILIDTYAHIICDNAGACAATENQVNNQMNVLRDAAIEAARAGEQGRGFAVVADEVRNLASRTNTSTEEIQSTINMLQELALGTASTMQKSQDLAYTSVNCAESCGKDLSTIVNHIQHVSDRATQIATAAEEQSAVAEDMNRNVASINDAALEMSQSANHLASESETLADMSRQLDQKLSIFKL